MPVDEQGSIKAFKSRVSKRHVERDLGVVKLQFCEILQVGQAANLSESLARRPEITCIPSSSAPGAQWDEKKGKQQRRHVGEEGNCAKTGEFRVDFYTSATIYNTKPAAYQSIQLSTLKWYIQKQTSIASQRSINPPHPRSPHPTNPSSLPPQRTHPHKPPS